MTCFLQLLPFTYTAVKIVEMMQFWTMIKRIEANRNK